MSVQVIMKDGRPEWAVLPYADYEALLAKVEAMSADVQSTGAQSTGAQSTGDRPSAGVKAEPMSRTHEGSAKDGRSELSAAESQKLRNTMLEQLQSVAEVSASGSFNGEKAAKLRSSKGFDEAHVAREIGISPVYLKQIESGERVPSEPILRNIARALGVDVKDLSDQ